MFIVVSTSVQNVANVVEAAMTSQYIREVIQERNHLNVVIVADDSQRLEALLCTAEFTVEPNRTYATCVRRHLVSLEL